MSRFAGVCGGAPASSRQAQAKSPQPVRVSRFARLRGNQATPGAGGPLAGPGKINVKFDRGAEDYDPFANTAPVYRVGEYLIDADHLIVPAEYHANPWAWWALPIENRLPLTTQYDLQPNEPVLDADGIRVPLPYRNDLGGCWMRLPKASRKRMSGDDDAFREKYETKPAAPRQKPYSTQYAVDWGKKQGWNVIDREAYNFLTKRHHDCELGMDVIFDDGKQGRVGVQAAGKGERKVHWDRFTAAGGVETAKRRAIRILYVVFERGNKTPLDIEEWA
jgi:hypothetical protein